MKDIKKEFNWCPSVEISAVPTDIALYVNGHQNMLPRFVGETPGLLQNIQDTLSEAAQGMFLIAQLSLEWLRTEIFVKDLENTLAQLLERGERSDLEQVLGKAYDETMGRIFSQNARHKELARKVLSWIFFAKDKLTTDQVQHALAVKDGDTRLNAKGMNDRGLMVSVCCGLVIVDEASGIIRLVHYTTQEYLSDNEAQWCPDIQAYLTKQFVSYLLLRDFEEGAVRAAYDARSSSLREVSMLPYSSSREPYAMDGLHLAARFGLHGFMDILLEKYDLDSKDGVGQTTSTWAYAAGHKDTAELLIQKSLACEEVSLDVQDSVYEETPLHRAASQGHLEIVEVLDGHGAGTEIKDSTGRTPIVRMILRGRDGIFEVLLKASGGQAEQIFYAEKQSLLSIAVGCDNKEVTQLLLDMGVRVDARDMNEWPYGRAPAREKCRFRPTRQRREFCVDG
ncbi:hypothetical protein FSARC_5986 [Fusarium sarcochroum]|uniref:GPI inositol-deacylase winged helix domain-containing protein n=1 Tax=Fusarium sarcochroum TaxID=1208366 RepID=A0A8H4TYG8_9HYPO|nr:hypothetical protein FSARC_5986 [Fusarium sarcochroum]